MPPAPLSFGQLLDALSRPDAYPHPASDVRVHQTHISVVFLAGPFAYKIKKPLDLGFLDFTTLEKRRAACEQEVRLNRRLAPRVYLGVAPVNLQAGRVCVNGPGETIEYAVWMERLPADRTFEALLQQGELTEALAVELARRVAVFHRRGACTPQITAQARWPVIARNCRENFEQIKPAIGQTLSTEVYERLKALTERRLEELRALVESRAARGVARDTHGDLHLDHVYSLSAVGGQDELVIIDCIEFNTRFRYADPVSDVAFLIMDLEFHARPDLARAVANAYFEAAGDAEGRELLDFYAAYRAVVRGKVEGFALAESEVPAEQKARLLRQARAHFLLALRLLAPPGERPALLMVGGLPGTGKSRLCRGLGGAAGFETLDSDVIRKELVGLEPARSASAEWGAGLYTEEWNDRTYAAIAERARAILWRGGRVAVAASFREEKRRLMFVQLARESGVPCLFLECRAEASILRDRLARRTGDASDADWAVYEKAARAWENAGPGLLPLWRTLDTGGTPEDSLEAAKSVLAGAGWIGTS